MVNALGVRTTPLDRHTLPPNAVLSRTASVPVLITGAVVDDEGLAWPAGPLGEACRTAVLIVCDSELGLSEPEVMDVVVYGRKAERI
jgi:hypothetical protein